MTKKLAHYIALIFRSHLHLRVTVALAMVEMLTTEPFPPKIRGSASQADPIRSHKFARFQQWQRFFKSELEQPAEHRPEP